MFLNMKLNDYIEETAKGIPAPGGGSVSGLVGSLGAALTLMGGNFTIDRKDFKDLDDDVRLEILSSQKEIEGIKNELKKIIYEDTVAFNDVLLGYKLPKETEIEKQKRNEAIERGYMRAIEVPSRCMELCLQILELQKVFVSHGNKNLIVDIGVGAILVHGALESSSLNIKTNLRGIKDEIKKEEIVRGMEFRLERARELKDEILELVEKTM